LNQLLQDVPIGFSRLIRAEVDKEKSATLKTAGTLFYNIGYYVGVVSLSGLILQIQALTYSRLEKQNIEASAFAFRVALEFLRDSTLFLNREKLSALERTIGVVGETGTPMPGTFLEQLEQLRLAEQASRNAGLSMDSEVAALSSLKDFPVELGQV
jgi:hypothetical protein